MRKKSVFIFLLSCAVRTAAQDDSLSTEKKLSDSAKPAVLQEVTVTGKKPFIQIFPDKTIINVESAITSAGATVLEVLEKSPGITIDRNGSIRLKGRPGVLIMIDGKPSQVSGNDLNNLLAGLSAAQIDQIEIMDNPPAKYDAAGNAGIINIKTKKNRQRGFNGNISLSAGQGRYFKTLNNGSVNFFRGKLNLFSNISANQSQGFTDLYAIRSYYDDDNKTVTSLLEQPSFFKGRAPSQTVKAGVDYFPSAATTIGLVAGATSFSRGSSGNNTAIWMNESGNTDSVITTTGDNKDRFRNFTMNINARHSFQRGGELTADFDLLMYRIRNRQHFINEKNGADGYVEDINGNLPSDLDIYTGKADYSKIYNRGLKLEAGWKSARVRTDNRAEYLLNGNLDPGKTNHFLYSENIHAAYLSLEKKKGNLNLQGGLRYEYTGLDAHQLGNAWRKDSSFSRNYDGLFPTALLSLQVDSLHNFTFHSGRRIDRPGFQSLNPFVFVINKYTYQAGNPFYRPQYTWNFEVSHSFKNLLVTSLSYSTTKDYFSQIFLQDSNGFITYTEGNLDRMENFGLSFSVQAQPYSWWSFTTQANVNHKKIRGFVWTAATASLTQANMNINNQFTLQKGWSAELSGFFTLKEQELQEITDPTGQIGFGVAKQLWKNSATLRLNVRDVFYTQAMKGWTTFEQSTEYFRIKRDSRVATISFTYRFGRQAKAMPRRSSGGADEEMRRVNAG